MPVLCPGATGAIPVPLSPCPLAPPVALSPCPPCAPCPPFPPGASKRRCGDVCLLHSRRAWSNTCSFPKCLWPHLTVHVLGEVFPSATVVLESGAASMWLISGAVGLPWRSPLVLESDCCQREDTRKDTMLITLCEYVYYPISFYLVVSYLMLY